MLGGPSWEPRSAEMTRLVVILALTSWLTAAISVAVSGGFGVGDLLPFAFWCGLAGVAAYPALYLLRTRTPSLSAGVAYALALLCATFVSTAWTYSVQLLLGPAIMAFSFPVFFSWLSGASASSFYSVASTRPSTWPVAVALWIATPFAVVGGLRATAPEPPPDLIVVLPEGLTPAERDAAFRLFESPVTPTPKGYNPAGIRSVSAWDTPQLTRLRITFHANSVADERAAVIAGAIRSPLVEELLEVDPQDDGVVLRILKHRPAGAAEQVNETEGVR